MAAKSKGHVFAVEATGNGFDRLGKGVKNKLAESFTGIDSDGLGGSIISHGNSKVAFVAGVNDAAEID